jgi:hypothetical protein
MIQVIRHRTNRRRRGVAAVEFAVIAPLMLMLTFGLIEIGRVMLVKQTATHATREGARISVRPNVSNEEIYDRVVEELAIFGVDNAIIETDPFDIDQAPPGSPVIVRVRINAAEVSWVPGFFDWAFTEIVAESSMRRETTE